MKYNLFLKNSEKENKRFINLVSTTVVNTKKRTYNYRKCNDNWAKNEAVFERSNYAV